MNSAEQVALVAVLGTSQYSSVEAGGRGGGEGGLGLFASATSPLQPEFREV